jgi:two-component system NtrC family response regulator
MYNQAYPTGPDKAILMEIDEGLYRTAVELHAQQRFAESLTTVQEAMQRPAARRDFGGGPSVREGAILAAWNLYKLRRHDECQEWLRMALDQRLLSGDDPEAELIMLWIALTEGDYARVIDRATARIESFAGRLHQLLGEFFLLRGSASCRVGRGRAAMDDGGSAYSLFKILRKDPEQAEAANLLGIVLFQQSRYTESLKWLHESLEINQTLARVRHMGDNYLHLGLAYYKKGDYDEAVRFLNRAIEANDQVDSPNLLCKARIALGNVRHLQRDFADARRNLMTAYTLATERRLPREECLALEFLGDVLRDEGKPDEARRYYQRGLAIARRLAPDGDLVMELLRREGEVLVMLDRTADAESLLQQARYLARRLGDRFEEGVTCRCLAVSAERRGAWREAADRIAEALELLDEIGAELERARAHFHAARIHLGRAGSLKSGPRRDQQLEEALQQAVTAQTLYRKHDHPYWIAEIEELVASLTRHRLDALCRSGPAAPAPAPASAARGEEIVAVSARMRAFAAFEEAVLVTGETGTGKELIARRLHEESPRRSRPFVAVNCAAIPATLFEREFFGHHKGAYTGAEADTPGFVAQADGGTLFLDEIGEMPLELQPKLLRLLQDGTYTRLGDPTERRADVRLVTATNANLAGLVAQGRFRQDLHYRLRILEVPLAPLRQRREDIVPLMNHFLTRFAGKHATVWDYFDEPSVWALQKYDWPGNVREIMLVARRAHIGLEVDGRTRVELGDDGRATTLRGPGGRAAQALLGGPSRERVLEALNRAAGNKAEAARQLGVARQTLYRWLEKFDIPA